MLYWCSLEEEHKHTLARVAHGPDFVIGWADDDGLVGAGPDGGAYESQKARVTDICRRSAVKVPDPPTFENCAEMSKLINSILRVQSQTIISRRASRRFF
jgi:hypothetical protein